MTQLQSAMAAGRSVIEHQVRSRGSRVGDLTYRTLRIDQGQVSDTHVMHGPRGSPDVPGMRGTDHDDFYILEFQPASLRFQ
jgi:hypothetical protein